MHLPAVELLTQIRLTAWFLVVGTVAFRRNIQTVLIQLKGFYKLMICTMNLHGMCLLVIEDLEDRREELNIFMQVCRIISCTFA